MDFSSELRRTLEQRLDAFVVERLPIADRRPASVAICIVPDEQQRACFLLTRRAGRLRNHGGQWALPGGRIDEGEDAVQAALRELEEELGVRSESVEVIGRLDDFATRSGYAMTPILAWARGPVVLRPCVDEVEAAYRVPLEDLDHPDAPLLSSIPESDRPVLSMPLLGQKVHAPTAAILYQLLEVCLRGRATRVAHYEQPRFAWK